MTPLETIAAVAVAVLGTWLLWPCLAVTGILLFFGLFAGGILISEWLDERRKRRAKSRSK